MKYCIGVDVGSGSVRAGIYSTSGENKAFSSRKIKNRKPEIDFVEQSSTDIWENVCGVVRDVVQSSNIAVEDIVGLGFDATCSLVAVDRQNNPVSVNKDGDDYWNIIMWMDHRAKQEAEEINSAGHEVLKYVGGKISLEMEIPKIWWLKRNLPENYDRISQFFDLADYLQYRATGSNIRSSCTVACKWTYLAHENRWDTSFFESLGLQDLIERSTLGESKIGHQVKEPGALAGTLTAEAARQLGLSINTHVAVGLIDAHAGGLGSLIDKASDTLIIVAGTSACHMLNSEKPTFVPGVWGPYYNAMVPHMWLNEGGQSAYGSLLDYTVRNHSYYQQLSKEGMKEGEIYDLLNDEVERLRTEDQNAIKNLHVLDYHYGNRSPRADPRPRGMVVGMDMSEDIRSLARIYWATMQSICFGIRLIIDKSTEHGYQISSIIVCGGFTKNPLYLRELSDICERDIFLAGQDEAVLFGSALIAAIASGEYANYQSALTGMSKKAEVVKTNKETYNYYRAKYKVYLKMFDDQLSYEHIMNDINIV